MNITKEEYLQALDIVEAYHRQVKEEIAFIENNKFKTPIEKWVNDVKPGTRIAKALLAHSDYYKYIEDISILDFMRFRNIGKQAREEFCRLRGIE